MVKVTFIQKDGAQVVVGAEVGASLMQAAVKHAVRGIEAECGGACSCATCHVHVDPDWATVTGAPAAMEESMLEFADDADETSRLSCQIKVRDDMDGLVVRVVAD